MSMSRRAKGAPERTPPMAWNRVQSATHESAMSARIGRSAGWEGGEVG